ncbi:hypothetical protein WICPIJ_003477 [Wickerhamomyces pijperi]|uniref:Uncharacterized protein n=1 Tax=Wickerhamomyces pijperi TaxID=599730 RepID=A0A9P8TP70_WICPI|nr:hypothetical protein WICPIJ_003477 [Wickerhamomyces pijperi]
MKATLSKTYSASLSQTTSLINTALKTTDSTNTASSRTQRATSLDDSKAGKAFLLVLFIVIGICIFMLINVLCCGSCGLFCFIPTKYWAKLKPNRNRQREVDVQRFEMEMNNLDNMHKDTTNDPLPESVFNSQNVFPVLDNEIVLPVYQLRAADSNPSNNSARDQSLLHGPPPPAYKGPASGF